MAKDIKGDPRRTPPVPADHADIETWFDTLMPSVQPIVRELDAVIRAAVPDLEFAVKYRRAFYGLPAVAWIVELAPYAVSANVLFFGGAEFDPPPPLGSTGRVRYVKVSSPDEAHQPVLQDWLTQAAHIAGWT